MISDVLNKSYNKRCLLCYITLPFTSNKDENSEHTNYWQSREIVRQLDELGYSVDVVHYMDRNVILEGKYNCIIDILGGEGVNYWSNLNECSKKIVYFTGSNPSYTNSQVEERIKNIERRKNIHLNNDYKAIEYTHNLDSFDAAMLIGNEYVRNTYCSVFKGPIYLLSNNGVKYKRRINEENRCPKRFLFLGSTNQILKGLDLLLEVFSRNTDLELFICSPVENEKGFFEAYKTELLDYSNIHYLGWLDTQGDLYIKCLEKCAFVILPSCSEGCSGAVLNAMSGGLIPIVTRQTGLNEDEAIIFEDDNIDTIEKTIREYSNKSYKWIKNKSKYYKEIQEKRYSRENFSESLKHAFNAIGL